MTSAYKIRNVKYQQKLIQIKRLICSQIKAAFRYSGYFDEKNCIIPRRNFCRGSI